MWKLTCPSLIAGYLEDQGYVCFEKYYEQGQWCYVFQRDPFDDEIAIRVGMRNRKFQEYCQDGNVERIK